MRLNNNNSPGVLSYLRNSPNNQKKDDEKAAKESKEEDYLSDKLDFDDEKGELIDVQKGKDKEKTKGIPFNKIPFPHIPKNPAGLIKLFVEKLPPEKLEAYLGGDFDLPFRGIDPVKSRLITTILFKYLRQIHIHLVNSRLVPFYIASYVPSNIFLDSVVRGISPILAIVKPGKLNLDGFFEKNPILTNYIKVALKYHNGIENGTFGEIGRHYLRRIKKRNVSIYNSVIASFDHLQVAVELFPEEFFEGIFHPDRDAEEKDIESEKIVEEKSRSQKGKSIFSQFISLARESRKKESDNKESGKKSTKVVENSYS
ncbi:hypothetical protein K502DRAFT_354045 [Neoconidiobolus thromboides FSU 785]|nr:hypothetical protein K502DRAFT_354045 [Neoconidiobolus thromboides FSU 785]